MTNPSTAESRVYAAREACDEHLYAGQEVVISDRSTGLFGENGVIVHAGREPGHGEVIRIELTDRLTWGIFSRSEFRIRDT